MSAFRPVPPPSKRTARGWMTIASSFLACLGFGGTMTPWTMASNVAVGGLVLVAVVLVVTGTALSRHRVHPSGLVVLFASLGGATALLAMLIIGRLDRK